MLAATLKEHHAGLWLGAGRISLIDNTAAAVHAFKKAAELGNATGAYYLGWIYTYRLHLEFNIQDATPLFESSMKKNHPESYRLHLEFNVMNAIPLFESGMKKNHPESYRYYGFLKLPDLPRKLRENIPLLDRVPKDAHAAITALETADRLGSLDAKFDLAMLALSDWPSKYPGLIDLSRDHARQTVEKLAEQGLPRAIYILNKEKFSASAGTDTLAKENLKRNAKDGHLDSALFLHVSHTKGLIKTEAEIEDVICSAIKLNIPWTRARDYNSYIALHQICKLN